MTLWQITSFMQRWQSRVQERLWVTAMILKGLSDAIWSNEKLTFVFKTKLMSLEQRDSWFWLHRRWWHDEDQRKRLLENETHLLQLQSERSQSHLMNVLNQLLGSTENRDAAVVSVKAPCTTKHTARKKKTSGGWEWGPENCIQGGVVKAKGRMVDLHTITDIATFEDFASYTLKSHALDFADGEQVSGISLKRDTAKAHLRDCKCRVVNTMLRRLSTCHHLLHNTFSKKQQLRMDQQLSSKKVRTNLFTRTVQSLVVETVPCVKYVRVQRSNNLMNLLSMISWHLQC